MRPDLNDYPIVFSLNCQGPKLGDDRGIDRKVLLSKNGEASVEPGVGNSIGQMVCVNSGANLSLDAHLKPNSI